MVHSTRSRKWYSLPVACSWSVVFAGYSGFHHHQNWSPWYSWNIAESDVKHNKSNHLFSFNFFTREILRKSTGTRGTDLPTHFLTFCLHICFQKKFFLYLLFHPFLLVRVHIHYNLMLTTNYMCRPYIHVY